MVIGKIAVNIVPGLIPADADVLRQREFGNTIDYAEVHRLGMAALQRRHLISGHAKDLTGCGGVDIHSVTERTLHGLVVRDMGQYTQLNLAVVRVHQHISGSRYEHFPDLRPKVRADGDILQVGIRRRKPPCSRHQILERCVNAAVRADNLHKAVGIGALEFGQHPVVHDGGDNGVLILQLFQHIGIGGIAGLRLFPGGQAQFFKEQGAQLLGRLNIKGAIGIAVNQSLAVRDALLQHFAELGQLIPVNGNTPALHSIKHRAQGQLDFLV